MGLIRKDSASNVLATVACIFQRKRDLVQSVRDEYAKEEMVIAKALPCKSQSKMYQHRAPRSKMVLCQIREFICKRCEIRERVVAKDITTLLRSLGYQ